MKKINLKYIQIFIINNFVPFNRFVELLKQNNLEEPDILGRPRAPIAQPIWQP
jgi:hypothetical protein